jgi:hypothetical protein
MKTKAQSILEYAVVFGIVAAAIGAMQLYFRRGISATIKTVADLVGDQRDGQEIDPLKGTKSSSQTDQTTSSKTQTVVEAGDTVRTSYETTSNATGSSTYKSKQEE